MNFFRTRGRLVEARSSVRGTGELMPDEADALSFLLPLSEDYPEIERWYARKVIPGLRAGTRTLLRVERDGQLVGLGIAKNEADERKICTVRVAPEYAGRGIGVRIFDGLLRWLDHDKPHLTVSAVKLPLFERIFDYYGFLETSVYEGRYRPMASELGYNELVLSNSQVVPAQTSLLRSMTVDPIVVSEVARRAN